MKKIYMLFAIGLLALQGKSQISYGFHAGVSMTRAINKVTDPTSKIESKTASDMDPGLILGVMAEMPLGKTITIRPELNYLQKNYSNEFLFSDLSSVELKVRQHYLEIPVNILYHVPVGTGKMYFGLGPRFGMGIHGKAKANGNSIDIHYDGESNDYSINPDEYLHLKQFELGAGLVLGQQFVNGIYGSAEFNFGISNIDPDSEYSSIRQNMINLKIGYALPYKKAAKK